MSAQQSNARTPKHTYAAALQSTTLVNAQPTGVCTRSMARKIDVSAAAASLRTAKVPTKGRTFTAASIAAAAAAVIASNSPPHARKGSAELHYTPSPKTKVAPSKKNEVPEPCVASVMTIEAKTMEEQMLEMRRMLEQIRKDNEEKNQKIEDLQRELNDLREKEPEEINREVEMENDDGKIAQIETAKNEGVFYNEEQLQLMIATAVKTQLSGDSPGGSRYTKPYTRRIDSLRMPLGYQPPKFQQFDGKGSPKQHVAHFVETCNNAGTDGDLLVKQFVRSLKGIAFDWYTDLDAESIDSWDQMEDEFLNRFYSTRRVVSMSELTNTKQWENEPVVDYINRWRALSLECKDRISETSAVEMCIDGMSWELLYILKGIKPRSFQELATRAHDMEITVKGHGRSRASASKALVEKKEYKKTDKVFKSTPKEALVVSTDRAPVKITAKPKQEKRKDVPARDVRRDRLTLKELQAKKYPFPDSDLSSMLDDLLEKNIIKLPEPKRPDEVNRTNDPNYCRYHRLISHPIEKCITLKELIMRLAGEGKILLDVDEIVEANQIMTTTCRLDPSQPPLHILPHEPKEWCKHKVQFGSLEPVEVVVQGPLMSTKSIVQSQCTTLQSILKVDNDGGWTTVTRRKHRKQAGPETSPIHRERKPMIEKKSHHSEGGNIPKKIVKPHVLSINHVRRNSIILATLEEFFPREYFDVVSANVTSPTTSEDSDAEEHEEVSKNETSAVKPQDHSNVQEVAKVLSVLNALPASMGWKQIFHLSEEMRQEVVNALQNPKLYRSNVKDAEEPAEITNKCVSCHSALTFSDEDLLLGSKPHNRPLYVSGYIRRQKVNRILIDGGSGVNLMPKATMLELGIPIDELSDSRTVIHGFNLHGERAIGIIRLSLTMGDLSSDTLFHVIDAKTSFKLLLGRPWKHENGVVASTLHQCLKYYRGGERKINGDVKPFTKADSFFADAKFFGENDVSSELLPSAISSTGEGSKRREDTAMPKEQQNNQEACSRLSLFPPVNQKKITPKITPPILRYIPTSRRKNGESPFEEYRSYASKSSKEKKDCNGVRQEWVAKVVTSF